jgi:hypothetical protein
MQVLYQLSYGPLMKSSAENSGRSRDWLAEP